MAVREVARILPFIHVVWTSKVLSASFFVFAALFGGFFTTSNFLFSSLGLSQLAPEMRKAQK